MFLAILWSLTIDTGQHVEEVGFWETWALDEEAEWGIRHALPGGAYQACLQVFDYGRWSCSVIAPCLEVHILRNGDAWVVSPTQSCNPDQKFGCFQGMSWRIQSNLLPNPGHWGAR